MHCDRHFEVYTSDADALQHLKANALLCKMQDIANEHASALNFGFDQMIEKRCAWVLSRLKVRFLKEVCWRDQVVLRTWRKGAQGVFSLRDFKVFDPQQPDNDLILATTSWLIINLDTRRMQRADQIIGPDIIETAKTEHAIAEVCDKLTPPAELLPAGTHKVHYSDIDFNLHTNNTKYVEWSLDALDPDYLLHHAIDEFQINFNAESRLNDEVELWTGSFSKNEHYVEGRLAGKNVFQLLVKFKA